MLDIHNCFEYNIHVVNILKRFRLFWLILSLSCLFVGTYIYIAYRETTYINRFVPFVLSETIKQSAEMFFIPSKILEFLKYYFVDFLWAFSLNGALFAVQYKCSFKNTAILSFTILLLGCLFELFQLFSICIGTFDMTDIAMYFCASMLSVMINLIFKRRGLL